MLKINPLTYIYFALLKLNEDRDKIAESKAYGSEYVTSEDLYISDTELDAALVLPELLDSENSAPPINTHRNISQDAQTECFTKLICC
mgnify:CR=1 FL=1